MRHWKLILDIVTTWFYTRHRFSQSLAPVLSFSPSTADFNVGDLINNCWGWKAEWAAESRLESAVSVLWTLSVGGQHRLMRVFYTLYHSIIQSYKYLFSDQKHFPWPVCSQTQWKSLLTTETQERKETAVNELKLVKSYPGITMI